MNRKSRAQRDNWLLVVGYWLLVRGAPRAFGLLEVIILLLITNYPCLLAGRNYHLIFAQGMTEGFILKKMEGEKVRWEVEADLARFLENSNELEGIKFKFYPRNKEPFLIEADKGRVKENGRDEIYLKKNVQIKGYLRANVRCEDLYWDSDSGLMRTSKRVEIVGEKWQIKGEGMKFSLDGDVITIEKNVSMEINEKPK